MTRRVINQVRDYITIVTEDRVYQICPVEVLLMRHPPSAVVGFLEQLRAEYKKELRDLIRVNPTHPKINHLVVLNFRLKMAINTIKNAQHEETDRENQHEVEPRATGSSGLP
jgi:hypothetical protein